MSTNFELTASPREGSGTSDSRRLRRAGLVPGVMYGAGKDNTHVSFPHADLMHKLMVEAFHSAIINVNLGGETEQAIVRAVQLHPYRSQVLHIDLQRVKATEKLHMAVPLHFVGEDEAPGIRQEGGILSHLLTDLDITCLPRDLPEYIEVDVSGLGLNESLHLSDVTLPEGVELTHAGEDLAVASISPPKVALEEEAEEAGGEEDLDAEGAEAPAATPDEAPSED